MDLRKIIKSKYISPKGLNPDTAKLTDGLDFNIFAASFEAPTLLREDLDAYGQDLHYDAEGQAIIPAEPSTSTAEGNAAIPADTATSRVQAPAEEGTSAPARKRKKHLIVAEESTEEVAEDPAEEVAQPAKKQKVTAAAAPATKKRKAAAQPAKSKHERAIEQQKAAEAEIAASRKSADPKPTAPKPSAPSKPKQQAKPSAAQPSSSSIPSTSDIYIPKGHSDRPEFLPKPGCSDLFLPISHFPNMAQNLICFHVELRDRSEYTDLYRLPGREWRPNPAVYLPLSKEDILSKYFKYFPFKPLEWNSRYAQSSRHTQNLMVGEAILEECSKIGFTPTKSDSFYTGVPFAVIRELGLRDYSIVLTDDELFSRRRCTAVNEEMIPAEPESAEELDALEIAVKDSLISAAQYEATKKQLAAEEARMFAAAKKLSEAEAQHQRNQDAQFAAEQDAKAKAAELIQNAVAEITLHHFLNGIFSGVVDQFIHQNTPADIFEDCSAFEVLESLSPEQQASLSPHPADSPIGISSTSTSPTSPQIIPSSSSLETVAEEPSSSSSTSSSTSSSSSSSSDDDAEFSYTITNISNPTVSETYPYTNSFVIGTPAAFTPSGTLRFLYDEEDSADLPTFGPSLDYFSDLTHFDAFLTFSQPSISIFPFHFRFTNTSFNSFYAVNSLPPNRIILYTPPTPILLIEDSPISPTQDLAGHQPAESSFSLDPAGHQPAESSVDPVDHLSAESISYTEPSFPSIVFPNFFLGSPAGLSSTPTPSPKPAAPIASTSSNPSIPTLLTLAELNSKVSDLAHEAKVHSAELQNLRHEAASFSHQILEGMRNLATSVQQLKNHFDEVDQQRRAEFELIIRKTRQEVRRNMNLGPYRASHDAVSFAQEELFKIADAANAKVDAAFQEGNRQKAVIARLLHECNDLRAARGIPPRVNIPPRDVHTERAADEFYAAEEARRKQNEDAQPDNQDQDLG